MSELPPNITIRPMLVNDIRQVVEIHIEQFPGSRSTSLGRAYLRKMYRWFVVRQPELSLVILDSDQVIGFAVGAIGGYGRKIFRYALGEIVLGMLLHPRLLFKQKTYQLWQSYLKGLLPAQTRSNSRSSGQDVPAARERASLCSIAIARSAQGCGLGKALLGALEDCFREIGVTQVVLSVQSDNLPARRLYESCEWEAQADLVELGSTSYRKRLIKQQ
jgi:ribosomal protein S18 acetylase RimI-like enzyme